MALCAPKPALAGEAQCSTGVIDGLIAAGTLVEVAIPDRRMPLPNPAHREVDFAGAQAHAVDAVAPRPPRGPSP